MIYANMHGVVFTLISLLYFDMNKDLLSKEIDQAIIIHRVNTDFFSYMHTRCFHSLRLLFIILLAAAT